VRDRAFYFRRFYALVLTPSYFHPKERRPWPSASRVANSSKYERVTQPSLRARCDSSRVISPIKTTTGVSLPFPWSDFLPFVAITIFSADSLGVQHPDDSPGRKFHCIEIVDVPIFCAQESMAALIWHTQLLPRWGLYTIDHFQTISVALSVRQLHQQKEVAASRVCLVQALSARDRINSRAHQKIAISATAVRRTQQASNISSNRQLGPGVWGLSIKRACPIGLSESV
jgi:hypothetical protein